MGAEDCSYEHWKHLENLSSVTALLCCHDLLTAKHHVNRWPLSLVEPDQGKLEVLYHCNPTFSWQFLTVTAV